MGVAKVKVAKEFTHYQTTESDLWDITYPMKMVPVVEVLINNNGQLEKIIAFKVERVTDSRIKIYFSEPRSGQAHLIG